MIGSGVFLLPSSLAHYGGISFLGWLFTGAGAVLLALVFADLGLLMPQTGGPYVYALAAYGEFGGFLIAWGYWISILAGNAAIATALVGYLGAFWRPLSQNPYWASLLVLVVIWTFTGINGFRVRLVGNVQFVTLLLKLLPLIFVGILGIWHFHPQHFVPFNRSDLSFPAAFSATSTLTLWAFLGLESATIPAGYVRNPKRMIPLATVWGTVLALGVYLLATAGVMGLLSPAELRSSTSPFADAAALFTGRTGSMLVALAAVVSSAGALNGWILLQGQIPLAAARDGLFPPIFRRLSPRGTPTVALFGSSVLVSLFALLNSIKPLVEVFTSIVLLSTLASLLPYLFCSIALPLLSRRLDFKSRSGRKNVIAGLAFLYSLWAVVGSGKEIVFWGFLLLLLGLPVYVWLKWTGTGGDKNDGTKSDLGSFGPADRNK